MKAFIILMLSLFLFSCSSSIQDKYVCNCKQKKEVQEFVANHIKDANNMSDEEMEDVIAQLRVTAIKTICQQKPVWINHDGSVDWNKQKVDSCESIMDVY